MASFTFAVEKEIAVLGERDSRGFRMELNLVSFNGKKAKLDIRAWDSTHENMQKGIQLDNESAKKLRDALKEYDFE